MYQGGPTVPAGMVMNSAYAGYPGGMLAAPQQQPMAGPVMYQPDGPDRAKVSNDGVVVIDDNSVSAAYVPTAPVGPSSWFQPAFTGLLGSIKIATDGRAVLQALQVAKCASAVIVYWCNQA
jgi:hypothetical protein